MFLTEIGVDLIEGALGEGNGGGVLEPCNTPLVPYGIQKSLVVCTFYEVLTKVLTVF